MFYGLFVLAAVTLSDAMLSTTVTILVILQTLRAVGRMNADDLSDGLRNAYQILAIITFDSSALEPGCVVQSSFVADFVSSLLLVVLTSMLTLSFLCAVMACRPAAKRVWYKARIPRAMIVLVHMVRPGCMMRLRW